MVYKLYLKFFKRDIGGVFAYEEKNAVQSERKPRIKFCLCHELVKSLTPYSGARFPYL